MTMQVLDVRGPTAVVAAAAPLYGSPDWTDMALIPSRRFWGRRTGLLGLVVLCYAGFRVAMGRDGRTARKQGP